MTFVFYVDQIYYSHLKLSQNVFKSDVVYAQYKFPNLRHVVSIEMNVTFKVRLVKYKLQAKKLIWNTDNGISIHKKTKTETNGIGIE